MKVRCPWATTALSIPYHDVEWGVPVHDDRRLFELIVLEGAQAGLSWETILKKRDRYRVVFDDFDPALVACYDERKIGRLLEDPGIVRNRLKVHAAVGNARALLSLQERHGSFDRWLWGFVDGQPVRNAFSRMEAVPARTAVSDRLSKALLREGFKFVGSTISYAFMQASGMVNDHLTCCFRYDALYVS